MIIDSHSHVLLPVAKHIEIMAKENIEKTILFSTIVHPETTNNFSEFKNELQKLNRILRGEINPNEERIKAISELKSIINEHPRKFIGFGSCPIGMELNQTEKWINDYIMENSFKGIGELTLSSGQIQLTENIFKTVNEIGKYPLWFHTFNPLTLQDIKELLELSRKYPAVPVILGHGAGSYWLDIIEELINLKNVYFDISASFSIQSVKAAAELIPERVLYSVDLPYNHPSVMKALVNESVSDTAVKNLIYYENISRLLKI